MDVTHCQESVPRSLRGDLRPGVCMLVVGPDGRHENDHKAHMTVKGVGRVVFRWKNRNKIRPWRIVEGPPVIELPSPSSEVLNPRAPHRG